MKTMQETFNRVVEHAASMRSKSASADGGRCYYRFPEKNGACSACFVGALIDDEHYSREESGGHQRGERVYRRHFILRMENG